MFESLREPLTIDQVTREALYRDPGLTKQIANRLRGEAAEYLRLAQHGVSIGAAVAAAGTLHEAARLALTAVAAERQLAFRSEGTHQTALDYGLGVRAITRDEWRWLEQLRLLRNANNYQGDAIGLSGEQFTAIVPIVQRLVSPPPTQKRTIPPPPMKL